MCLLVLSLAPYHGKLPLLPPAKLISDKRWKNCKPVAAHAGRGCGYLTSHFIAIRKLWPTESFRRVQHTWNFAPPPFFTRQKRNAATNLSYNFRHWNFGTKFRLHFTDVDGRYVTQMKENAVAEGANKTARPDERPQLSEEKEKHCTFCQSTIVFQNQCQHSKWSK